MLKLLWIPTLAAIGFALSLPTSSTLTLQQNLTTHPSDLHFSKNLLVIQGCKQETYLDIKTRLFQARSLALRALSEAILGTSSTHGYRALFKTNDAGDTVDAIYSAIYDLRKLKGLKPDLAQPKAPRIACATRDSASTFWELGLGYDPWERCQRDGLQRGQIPAFYAEGTAYIFLCPAYFLQEKFPEKPHCPEVHNDRFAGDPNIFYKKYQVYTLVNQLLRFYLGDNALDGESDPMEQLDWNNCVYLLRGTEAVRNVGSLVLFVALVAQMCTNVPDPPHPWLQDGGSGRGVRSGA